MFVFEHYWSQKSFDAAREAFRSAYPVTEVPSNIAVQQLVTTFRDTGIFCLR
jgi:hypothetical protein